ncbi:hypothetical protein P7G51_10695 [Enterococcus asini]|uniref:hypothetical protein n=1 Tax=Enterococcus TaxID=1350 RepID=UPI0028928F48|nr:hypothetical protein [Enterococcus asini]MDT2757847.1 hypothetical protein [Enterococcus asini]
MALTIKQTEDYLTSKVSGITVMDVSIEYPEAKEVLYIEGELDYFVFIKAAETYQFTDGKKNIKLDSKENPDAPLSEEEFLERVVKIILSEE